VENQSLALVALDGVSNKIYYYAVWHSVWGSVKGVAPIV